MSRILQVVLVGCVALGLGFFLGRKNFSRHANAPSSSGTNAAPSWDLTSLTPEERKSRCLEELGALSVPLLPAPEIDPTIVVPLKTNFEGEVFVKWRRVDKAKQYVIVVEDAEGKALKSYKTSTTSIYLKALPRADKQDLHAFIRLATQNLNDLIGVPGKRYSLVIKPPLDLSAPKIKEIKIED